MQKVSKMIEACNNLKSLLISSSNRKKAEAIAKFISMIKSNYGESRIRICDYLVKADFIQLLNETLSTVNSTLTFDALKCIQLLLCSNCFYKERYLSYTFDSLLRTLQISLKRKDNRIISKSFSILSTIIVSIFRSNLRLTPACDVGQLLIIISNILNESSDVRSLNNASDTLIILMQFEKEIQVRKDLVTSTLLQTIFVLCRNDQLVNRLNKLAQVSTLSFRFIHHSSENFEENYNSLLKEVVNVLETILLPILMDCSPIKGNENLFLIIRTILSFYVLPVKNIKLTFSVGLLKMGFLEKLLSFETMCKEECQFLLIRSLIYEVLVCLSDNLLGGENWKCIFKEGLLRLSINDNFKALKRKHISEVKVIIVFNYFKLLRQRRPHVDRTYLMELFYLIVTLKTVPSEVVVKAIWFEIAVGSLSLKEKNIYFKKSIKILVSFIKNCDFRKIYTHHEAILHWSFSEINHCNYIKNNVMCLWLENNDYASQKTFMYFLLRSKDVSRTFLEILASPKGYLAQEVMSLMLSSLIKNQTTLFKKFTEEIWSFLPHLFAKNPILSAANIAKNVAIILKICSDSVPEKLEKTVLLRICSFLPEIITNYYRYLADLSGDVEESSSINALRSIFLFTTTVIEQALIKQEIRVLQIVLKNEEFLMAIESCFTNLEDDFLRISILKLLGYMLQFQLRSSVRSTISVRLPTPKMINLICRDVQLATAGIRLLALYLEGYYIQKVPIFIQIAPPTPTELRALYIHIHMICAQADDEVGDWCWLCLQHLLNLSHQMKLQYHLAALPYTPDLLLTCSPQSKAWTQMIAFLPVWISSLPSINRRAFTFSRIQRSLSKLANTFLAQTKNMNEPSTNGNLMRILKTGAFQNILENPIRTEINILKEVIN